MSSFYPCPYDLSHPLLPPSTRVQHSTTYYRIWRTHPFICRCLFRLHLISSLMADSPRPSFASRLAQPSHPRPLPSLLPLITLMPSSYRQGSSGSAAEREYPAGQAAERQFTLRAVVVGLLVGAVVNFSNMYFGLQSLFSHFPRSDG